MSRLETVRRVAELREAAARAGVAAAQAARAAAEHEHDRRRAALAATGLSAGAALQVRAELASNERLAGAVTAARSEVGAREQDRSAAVTGWVDAARRARLLDEVCTRHREQRELGRERSTQHLLDDLSARRTRGSA